MNHENQFQDAAEILADLIVTTTWSDLSDTARRAIRLDMLDTVGCAIAGRTAASVPESTALFTNLGGSPQSGVWGTGTRLPAQTAAFINGLAGHALDFDDKHPAITHTGTTVIPPAIAAAEAAGVDDLCEVLLAATIGIEVADRMAHAVLDGPGVTGWLLTPLVGYFGAAAAVARLFGSDISTARNALGFAYVQASGNGQSTIDGALGKRMQAGFAARGGVFAAELASAGLTGPWNSLEGKRGFYHVYHRDRYRPEALRRSTEHMWLVEEATYKPFPCCGWTHAALECAQILAKEGLQDDQVEKYVVGVNAQAYASVGSPLTRRYQPQTAVDAQFSIPYTFGTAFTTGNIVLADFELQSLSETSRLSVAQKVTVEIDDEIEARWGRGVSPARVRAFLTDRTVREVFVEDPLGELTRPLDETALLEKFRGCTEYVGMPTERSDRIAELILHGEGPGSATELFDLLNAQTPGTKSKESI